MFTGLIEHLGTVVDIKRDEGGCTLTIGDSAPILGDCHIGDSIAVNGACLTVVEFNKEERGGWFAVWLANETLDKTDLGERVIGEEVNLERAMAAHVRFGGHFVQAHVDTTVRVIDRTPDGDSVRLTFELVDETMLPYLVPKGYAALDGASLTLTFVDDEQRKFGVMLIKHTQEKITLGRKKVGSKVNLEVDMLGKYVQKSVAAALRSSKTAPELQSAAATAHDNRKGESRSSTPSIARVSQPTLPQVTARLDHSRPPSPLKPNGASPRPKFPSRSPSPSKLPSPSPVVRPKAKINSSANINVRKTPQTSPRSAVSFRAPSPFKANQRVENKTIPGTNSSSISISRPPSVKPQAVGMHKSISSSSTVARSDRSVVLSNVTSRANASSHELGTRRRRASITLQPPKPTATGSSRTAPSSPLVPGVIPHGQNYSTLSSLRNLQPSPTLSVRITSKVSQLSVNVKPSNTSEPATPNSMSGLGHRPRVPSVSNQRIAENSSISPPSHASPSISVNTKFAAAVRPRVSSISQSGLHFNPPSTSATPTPASVSSTPPLRSTSSLSRHRRVPSMAKSDIIHSFSPLQGNNNENVTIQAPRPTRPNAGPPPVNFNFKYSPFSTLSASNINDNPRPISHSKTNSTPGVVSMSKFSVIAKVDPLFVPLPVNSPPASTISYTSRSTVSSSSATSTSPQHSALSGIGPTLNSHDGTGLGMGTGVTHRRRVSGVSVSGDLSGNLNNWTDGSNATSVRLRNGTQGGIQSPQGAAEETGDSDAGSSLPDDLDLDEEDRDVSEGRMRAQAKSIRKIEDLEITNRSLMVINASLEAAKHRQAKEIRDLRRKLRESRLILPPKAYRLVTSDTSPDAEADDDDDDDDDDDVDDVGSLDVEKIKDEGFKRCLTLLETLLGDGRRAVAAKPEDFAVTSRSATKVLHAEELRNEADLGERNRNDDDAETSIMTVGDDSEGEVEGMVSIRVTTPMPSSP